MLKSFEGFFEENPGHFQGVPLGDQKFVFGVSFDATHNVAELEVKGLSES